MLSERAAARGTTPSESTHQARLRARVSTFAEEVAGPEAQGGEPGFVRRRIEGLLRSLPDFSNYGLREQDPRYLHLVDSLLADDEIRRLATGLAPLVWGYTTGDRPDTRRVHINVGIERRDLPLVLIHELIHFYKSPLFDQWIAESFESESYEEGFTEYLTRLVLETPAERERNRVGNPRNGVCDLVTRRVAAYIPPDDIARAYFLGEVWRLETRSPVARREAGSQLGLRATGSRREQIEATRTGPGINQTVAPGRHYRFMNLGFDRSAPKPEHVEFFRRFKSSYLDPDPTLGVRFIGHASGAGTLEYNRRLSLRRSQAFYQMARDEGVPDSRLIDASSPPHHGETRPTAEEEDPATRAFNRRVEMTIRSPTEGGAR
jgi:outer membrane protein OmpA-like peptidoglycan-associated protein